MLAKIKSVHRISETLGYNEQKLALGQANCLVAENFVKDLADLSRRDKLHHFTRLTSLNEDVFRPGIHISINFHPTDRLSNDRLATIGKEYMERMRFGRQPYLIYRHTDAAHPHLHALTTYIQKDGSRLDVTTSNFRESQRIIHDLEQTYCLARSGRRERMRDQNGQPLTIQYGKVETMPAISRVLDKVVGSYKCISMEELNAVLSLYNVEAYRGKEGSRLRQYGGLIYRVLNEKGKTTGSQIKASLFDSKPTLKNLEKQFQLNRKDPRKQEYAQHIQAGVDWTLAQKSLDKEGLQKALHGQRITMVWMKEGLFYVDHQHKTVFEGRRLGDRYYGQGLEQRYGPAQSRDQQQSKGKQRGRDELSLEL